MFQESVKKICLNRTFPCFLLVVLLINALPTTVTFKNIGSK